MNNPMRAGAFLAVSFAAALVAVVVVWSAIASMERELLFLTTEEPTATVVVAAHTLGQGQPIGGEDLALMEIPEDYVPNSVIRSRDQVLQRVARERILAGEMIREERLAQAELGPSMAALIPRGMRAVSVNLAGGAAVSGFLNPGNHVDVLVTVTEGRDGRPPETVTLLQTVRVLSVDDRLGAGSESDRRGRAPAVSLLVTPEEAEKLTHAVTGARVSLVLRSDVDVVQHPLSTGTDAADLLGKPAQRATVRQLVQSRPEDGSTIFYRGPVESRE